MIYACRIKNGKVSFSNRYVDTNRLRQEKAAGHPLGLKVICIQAYALMCTQTTTYLCRQMPTQYGVMQSGSNNALMLIDAVFACTFLVVLLSMEYACLHDQHQLQPEHLKHCAHKRIA